MSALLRPDTQSQIKDSAFNRIFKAEKKRIARRAMSTFRHLPISSHVLSLGRK